MVTSTEAVRRRPYSVILLDEVEKAHPDVFNILLQVLDDGRLTDGQGRTVDFRNTVIVMTSNLGSNLIQEQAGDSEADYLQMKASVLGVVQAHFRPEFINRLDDLVVFRPLDKKQIRSIARIQLDYLAKRLAERQLSLDLYGQGAGSCWAARASIRCTVRVRSSGRSSSSWRTRWRNASCKVSSRRGRPCGWIRTATT